MENFPIIVPQAEKVRIAKLMSGVGLGLNPYDLINRKIRFIVDTDGYEFDIWTSISGFNVSKDGESIRLSIWPVHLGSALQITCLVAEVKSSKIFALANSSKVEGQLQFL